MPNLDTLQYRTSILNRLRKFFPALDIDATYDKLDKLTNQQLNRYWALIQTKDLDTLREEFYS